MTAAFPYLTYASAAIKLERSALWGVPAWSLLCWLIHYVNTPFKQHNWVMATGLLGLIGLTALLALWQNRLYPRVSRAWLAMAEGKTGDGKTGDNKYNKVYRIYQEQSLLWIVVVAGAYGCCREPALLFYLCWPLLVWSWLFNWRTSVVQLGLTTGLILMLGLLLPALPVSITTLVPVLGVVGIAVLALCRLNVWINRQDTALEQLQSQASTDALTGLINRRQFNVQILSEMARARRHRSPLTLALFDIDHFKQINDQFGHSMGDRILRELGAQIQQNVREHDVCARYGGEEFALILPETPADAAVELMERLRTLIGRTVFCLPDQPLGLTVSVGVAVFYPDEDVMFSFVERADVALYAAKNNGRDQVVFGVEPLDNNRCFKVPS